MPLYEYECVKCRSKTEELLRADEKPEIKCPVCGALCERIVSKVHAHGLEKGRDIHYKLEKAMEKGKLERSAAEEQSHMGPDPYGSMPTVEPDILDV